MAVVVRGSQLRLRRKEKVERRRVGEIEQIFVDRQQRGEGRKCGEPLCGNSRHGPRVALTLGREGKNPNPEPITLVPFPLPSVGEAENDAQSYTDCFT